MPRFAYQALSADGETVNGEMLADTEVSALDQLARRGLIPVLLSHGAGTGPWWQREVTLFSPSGRLTPVELERVFSTLAALLPFVADSTCTPQDAAHRLLTSSAAGGRNAMLAHLAADEAAVAGISSTDPTPAAQTDAERIIATTKLFQPRAVARTTRG